MGVELPTRADLLAQHHELAQELAGKHNALGTSLAAEREAKVNGWRQAWGETDKRRDQMGSMNAVENSKTSLTLQNEIAALQEERDDIRLQLQYGGYREG